MRWLWTLLLLIVSAGSALAQTAAPATLIADRVEILADGRLLASGSVEVFQGPRRLTATSITYSPDGETLDIRGPLVITDSEAGAIVLADQAELDTQFRNGLIRSARMVLNRELQLASAEITRVDGRYTQLTRTTTSSCEVCAKRPVPLWQIKSDTVIHDELERQLYFENARLDVLGVPVLWVPRLRLPDPTLKRATGFLTPSLRSTDELGLGIKIPYFIKIGDHKDLTLTPYLSVNRTQTLEARYRQAFRRGDIEINGAISDDDIIPNTLRGYVFAEGDFDLPQDFKLAFDLQAVTDDSYLFDYDYSGADRLISQISVNRVRRDSLLSTELVGFYSLRSNEDNETQPFLISDTTWVHRFVPGGLGGVARVELAAHGHYRNSDLDMTGRDVSRLTGVLDWRREWIGRTGIQLAARTQLRLDQTWVSQDSRFQDQITEVTPSASVELRWPWSKQQGRVTQVIEPIAMIAWTPEEDRETPNDESTQLEFDEGNLFALSRFPAGDELERGLRANVGLRYARHDPAGWDVDLTFGRTYRNQDFGQFAGYEFLEGDNTNWTLGTRVELPGDAFSFETRTLMDDDLQVTRSDNRFAWAGEMTSFAGTYTWLNASPAEGRLDDTNEWRLSGAWQVDDHWHLDTDLRYDNTLDRMASARLGVEYRTECAIFDFSVRRRFTDSAAIRPTTDFNFEVSLTGFGNNGDNRPRPHRPGCAP